MIIFNDWEVKQRLEEQEAKVRWHEKLGYEASQEDTVSVLNWIMETLGLQSKKAEATTVSPLTRKAS